MPYGRTRSAKQVPICDTFRNRERQNRSIRTEASAKVSIRVQEAWSALACGRRRSGPRNARFHSGCPTLKKCALTDARYSPITNQRRYHLPFSTAGISTNLRVDRGNGSFFFLDVSHSGHTFLSAPRSEDGRRTKHSDAQFQ